jgi:hypothetical protein
MFSNRKLILVTLLLVTFSATAYVLLVVIPARVAQQSYDGAKQIGRDIADAFHFTPEVTVNNTIVLQQQTPILELATITQTFQHTYAWTNTWLGSTKKINIKGSFAAKAGFDLQQKFSVAIQEDEAIITLPRPQLLSLESQQDVTFEDEHGVINWVNMNDRSKALNAFTSDARKFAQQAEFVDAAQREVEQKLREILSLHGKTVVVRYVETGRIESY